MRDIRAAHPDPADKHALRERWTGSRTEAPGFPAVR